MFRTIFADFDRMMPACRAGVLFIAVVLGLSVATPASAHAPDAGVALGQINMPANVHATHYHFNPAYSDNSHIEHCGAGPCVPDFLPTGAVYSMTWTPEIMTSASAGSPAFLSTPPPLRPPRVNA